MNISGDGGGLTFSARYLRFEMSTADVPSGVVGCTPSTQLLYHIIRREDCDMTRTELREVTGLSRWTVRTSIAKLRELGMVEERHDPQVPQQKLVYLSRPSNL